MKDGTDSINNYCMTLSFDKPIVTVCSIMCDGKESTTVVTEDNKIHTISVVG